MAAVTALVIAGCGGASDSVDGDDNTASGSGDGGRLSLVAYAVPKVGFDKVVPLFQKTPEGQGVTISQSYGASGDQSRKVENGLETDIVNFSLEPDITRLVKAGLVDEDWKDDKFNGIVSSSVVTLVVRKGNPKNIRDWDDVVKPGVKIINPNPFSSGSAKWNILAPYALKSDGGKNVDDGIDFVTKLIGNLEGQPKSGREATELFLQGAGDVLLSYENEALFAQRNGEPIEYVTPPTTFLIENPLAIVNKSKNPEKVQAFKDFLYSAEGQRAWGEAGFRPVDPEVAAEFDEFPPPEKLYTIADFGGWDKVNAELFDPDNGTIAKIYDQATS
ncbi:MAG: sulfate ABC transporter substrate-binding protein [Solirubrobacteraceae bacterium]|nr:sulfate ABC transporter substrate-binding protein [Solirubrobacteraceae bacterium]